MNTHALRVMVSRERCSWSTPADVYADLDREFRFTLDPCPLRPDHEAGLPLFGTDGLALSWSGHRVFCNPPYGPLIGNFLAKHDESDLAVYLLPSRTDTRWWHTFAPLANEVRFVRGRLRFGDGRYPAPFPSVVLVYSNLERAVRLARTMNRLEALNLTP